MTLPRAAICLLFCFLLACSNQATHAPSIGEAYAGPTTLPLHQDLDQKSAVATTVKHGEKLEILEYRRRFVKVRTAQGTEGWTDNHLLLTPQQMAGLRSMAESTQQYPSQGAATVFEPLNMHTEPNRTSPSFWQIPDNAKVDVIGHKLSPRNQVTKAVVIAPPVKPPRRSKKKQTQPKVAPPPEPPAPKPPDNWVALSVPKKESLEPEMPAPVNVGPADDWSLVRTKDGHVGWVLTRMLTMAIPDEVAQYAEGHRITSYFALGEVRDGDTVKPNWLWTTITKGQEPYEFDSFRVFVWSHRHHRYETGYIERRVTGHFPVHVDTSGSAPRFSVVLEDDTGHLYRKTYTFEGFHVRMVNKEPYQTSAEADAAKPRASPPVQQPPKDRSWYARIKDRVRRLFH
ncbi:MAG TPA: SH3 domain-containing protein [Bryobacteraceae bacterium]|nr:SH3 domain-containing protein [Bryobacteraceae bacterium]